MSFAQRVLATVLQADMRSEDDMNDVASRFIDLFGNPKVSESGKLRSYKWKSGSYGALRLREPAFIHDTRTDGISFSAVCECDEEYPISASGRDTQQFLRSLSQACYSIVDELDRDECPDLIRYLKVFPQEVGRHM